MRVDELTLLVDEPVADHRVDELQLLPFSKVIAGTAIGTRGPFTIGVFADWGQGKSSVLRQVRSLITQDPDQSEIVCVWFNAWQYEKEEHPIVPLVATIVRSIERSLAGKSKVSAATARAMRNAARALRAVAYGFSAKGKVKIPGFAEIESGFVAKEMIDRYDKLQPTADPLLDRSLYYNAFEVLGASVDSKGVPKIVIFVDDLDRCLPDQGLKLLESIKLIFSQPGFIFVLAVDRRVIEGFLRKRYKDDFGVEDYESSGTSYFDKIVQLPMPLPPHQGRFERYVRALLERDIFNLASNAPVKEALIGLTGLLSAGSGYNPRSLVRFINNLIVDRAIWAEMGEKVEVESLALCAVSRILRQHLGERHYRILARTNSLCDALARSAIEEDGAAQDTVRKKPEGVLKEILDRLNALESVQELLSIDEVQRWLTEHETRRIVTEFLVTVREQESTDEATQLIGLYERLGQATLEDVDALAEAATSLQGEWAKNLTNMVHKPIGFEGYFMMLVESGEILGAEVGAIVRGDTWDGSDIPMFCKEHGRFKNNTFYIPNSFLVFLGPKWDSRYLKLYEHLSDGENEGEMLEHSDES